MRVARQYIAIFQGVDYSNTEVVIRNDWVIAQRENISLRVSNNLLETSQDNSMSFNRSIAFSQANKVREAYIHKNGNITLFTTDNKIYKTDYFLNTIVERIVYEADGVTPYPIHTPINTDFRGMYYNTTASPDDTLDNDVYVFGNYANAFSTGAAPIHVVYSADFGETFKVCYKFGQNTAYRNDGTANGTSGTGDLLGDPNNPIVTRHVHAVKFCPHNGKYYMFTGDANRAIPANDEIHWFEGTYDKQLDTWSWIRLDFGLTVPIEETSNLKTTDCFFEGDTMYYASDYTGGTDITKTGLWKVKIDDINDPTKHEQIIPLRNANDAMICVMVDRNTSYIVATIVKGPFPTTTYELLVAKDFGNGDFAFKTFGNSYLLKPHSVNKKGFFRMNNSLDWASPLHEQSLFIKVGDDLFDNL